MVILKCKDYEECSKVASEIFIDAKNIAKYRSM